MITISSLVAIAAKYGKPILELVKKYYKEIAFLILIIWVVACCSFHFKSGQDSKYSKIDTVSVDVDTVWIYPDTNLIIFLHGFDTIPTSVDVNEEPQWIPPKPSFINSVDCIDSINEVMVTLEMANALLERCDSAWRWHAARRVYNDTVENDSIRLNMETVVNGFRVGTPTVGYTWLKPQETITKTVTIEKTLGPYRKMFVGAGTGPRLPWSSDKLNAIVGSLEAGYTDKKNNSFGLNGDFSQHDYEVKFMYRKSFNVGK